MPWRFAFKISPVFHRRWQLQYHKSCFMLALLFFRGYLFANFQTETISQLSSSSMLNNNSFFIIVYGSFMVEMWREKRKRFLYIRLDMKIINESLTRNGSIIDLTNYCRVQSFSITVNQKHCNQKKTAKRVEHDFDPR